MKIRFGNIFICTSLALTLTLFIAAKISGSELSIISWVNASRLISLLGTTLLAISFLLSSRFSFLENWFGGLDKVYRLHHVVGGLSFVFLLHHPLFLLVSVLPNLTSGWKYIWFSNILSFNYGLTSLYFMLLMILLTLFIKLPYSVWKKTHELMGIALIFATLHIITITSDVSRFMPLRYWIFFLLFISIISAFYRRFLYRFIGPKFDFLIKAIERRGDVLVLDLQPVNKEMKPLPGQFIFIRFEGVGNEAHPFSIFSIGLDGTLRIGVKILGDHTLQMISLVAGKKAVAWGPYGKFWESYFSKKDLIMIAGGIGVTPFLSMIEQENRTESNRKESNRNITLIYCVKNTQEAVFDADIKNLIFNSSNITYFPYSSEDLGRIESNKIMKITGDLSGKKIMICGPNSMMTSLTDQFLKLGVKNRDIIFEDFNLK